MYNVCVSIRRNYTYMDQKPMTNKQVFILILGITAFVVPLILYLSHLFPDKPTKIDDEGV